MAAELTAHGTFDVDLEPGDLGVTGMVAMTLSKVFNGDLVGSAEGMMLSAGDPSSGNAGYVALEVVTGSIGEHTGTFALQQLGTMAGGDRELTYLVVPGSGRGDFVGITGTLHLTIDDTGHTYRLEVVLPG